MKYLNEQRKEQRLVAATIQNEDFFHKIKIEFAWSFVKFLQAMNSKELQNHNHLQPKIWHCVFLPYKYRFY